MTHRTQYSKLCLLIVPTCITMWNKGVASIMKIEFKTKIEIQTKQTMATERRGQRRTDRNTKKRE